MEYKNVVKEIVSVLEETQSCNDLERARDILIRIIENVSNDIAAKSDYADYEPTNFLS